MALTKTESIWMNGRLVPWDEAKVHVLSHVIHYGSGLFEGIRCYKTPKGPAIFRLREHVQRLFDGCAIYRMQVPNTLEEIEAGILETIRANRLEGCYVRPIVYRGYGSMGVDPSPCPVEVTIAVWPWGAYLGQDAAEKGVDVMVSSWRRFAPDTLPAMAKASANYMNSQLIKMEATANGYAEGIALDVAGFVSEGSGENIFLVRQGTLYTPTLGTSILPGITRASIRQLASDFGIPVVECPIPREMLYVVDEVFFVGTATEVTPVRSIDRIPVGSGARGEITTRLQAEFNALVRGEKDDRHGWLTAV
jgi:branched-chain amino acid aminotransferase